MSDIEQQAPLPQEQNPIEKSQVETIQDKPVMGVNVFSRDSWTIESNMIDSKKTAETVNASNATNKASGLKSWWNRTTTASGSAASGAAPNTTVPPSSNPSSTANTTNESMHSLQSTDTGLTNASANPINNTLEKPTGNPATSKLGVKSWWGRSVGTPSVPSTNQVAPLPAANDSSSKIQESKQEETPPIVIPESNRVPEQTSMTPLPRKSSQLSLHGSAHLKEESLSPSLHSTTTDSSPNAQGKAVQETLQTNPSNPSSTAQGTAQGTSKSSWWFSQQSNNPSVPVEPLKSQLDSLKIEKMKLEQQLQAAQEQIQSMQQESKHQSQVYESQVTEWNAKLLEKEKGWTDSVSELSRTLADLNIKHSELSRLYQQSMESKTHLEIRLQEWTCKAHELEETLDLERSQVKMQQQKFQSEIALKSKELESLLETHSHQRQKTLLEHEQQVQVLTLKFQEKIALLETANEAKSNGGADAIQALQEKYTVLIQERDKALAQKEWELQELHAAKEREGIRIQQDMELRQQEWQSQIHEWKQKCAELTEQIQIQSNAQAQVTQTNQELQSNLVAFQSARQEWESQKQELSTTVLGLQEQIQRLNQDKEKWLKDMESLESKEQHSLELQRLSNQIIQIQKEHDDMVQSKKQEAMDYESKVKLLSDQIQVFQSERSTLEKKLKADVEDKHKKEKTTLEERYKKEKQDLEERLNKERAQAEEKFTKERTNAEEKFTKERAQAEERFTKERAQAEDKFTKERQKWSLDLENKKKEVATLETLKAELTEKLKKLQADLDKAKKDASANESSKQDTIKKLEKEVSAKGDEITKLNAKLKSMETEISNLKADHAKVLESMEKKIQDVLNEKESKLKESEKTLAEYPQLKAEIEGLKEQVSNLNSQNEVALAEYEVLKQSYDRSCKSIAEKEEMIKKTKAKVEETVISETNLKKSLSRLEKEKTELLSKIQELERNVSSAQESLEAQKSTSHRVSVLETMEKTSQWQSQMDELHSLNAGYQTRIHDLESELRITERKNALIVKDLQKQLLKERKQREGESHETTVKESIPMNVSEHKSNKSNDVMGIPKLERLTDDLLNLVSENEGLNKRARIAEEESKSLHERLSKLTEELETKSKMIQQYILRDNASKLTLDDKPMAQKGFNLNILSSGSAMQKMDPILLTEINLKMQKLLEEMTVKMNRMENELASLKLNH